MTPEEKQAIISQSIQTQSKLWLRYQNKRGEIKAHTVIPLRWENRGFFIVTYPNRPENELTFHINGVLDCHLLGDEESNTGLTATKAFASSAAAVAVPISQRRIPRQETQPSGDIFSQVFDPDEWLRLVEYYRQCLVVENRQQYIVEGDQLFVLNFDLEDVEKFLEGKAQFTFDLDRDQALARFLRAGEGRWQKQLCVGYPLLAVDDDKFAPLLYCPVDIREEQENVLELYPERVEISYAVLSHFGFKEEEIAAFLTKVDALQQDGSSIHDLKESVVELLVENIDPSISEQIIDKAAMFWVMANSATRALIEELKTLRQPDLWYQVSYPVRYLFSSAPDHSYPESPPIHDDPVIYVTPVNENQRQAIKASEVEPLTVVTGPPGTGKSQLVLNMIVNAFFRGETVLFASKNNKAVDVVMRRFKEELDFSGAIRSGNRTHREIAAQDITRALDKAARPGLAVDRETLRQEHRQTKEDLIQKEEELSQIRELLGLLHSQQEEREAQLRVLKELSSETAMLASQGTPKFHAPEAQELREELQKIEEAQLPIKADIRQMGARYNQVFIENQLGDPAIDALLRVDHSIGGWGDGLLKTRSFEDVHALQTWLTHWETLLHALDSQAAVLAARNAFRNAQDDYVPKENLVSVDWKYAIEPLARAFQHTSLSQVEGKLQTLEELLSRIVENRFTWWEHLSILLGLKKPALEARRQYGEIVEGINQQLEVSFLEKSDDSLPPEVMLADVKNLKRSVAAALAKQHLDQTMEALDEAHVSYESRKRDLSESLAKQLELVSILQSPLEKLWAELRNMIDKTYALQSQLDTIAKRLNALLADNELQLEILKEFKSMPWKGSQQITSLFELWMVKTPARLNALALQVRKWERLLSFWSIGAEIEQIEDKLAQLPTEEEAIQQLHELQDILLQCSRKLLSATWYERTQKVSSQIIQKTRLFAQGFSPEKFDAALNLFPIWATTNLSAKSTFPLEPQLFDLVIIDEASQCDVPSALPLLYRGKRAVIIGDQKQLRHIATIPKATDKELARIQGIDWDAIQYTGDSLFDLAYRSMQPRPGALILKEHYRSDDRIISFSNRFFYDNQLRVKTDLTQRGFRRDFLNDYGGMFWLDVPGETVRPKGGSAYNPAELKAIEALLPRLIKNLAEGHGLQDITLGIVTPYRAQANQLERIVERLVARKQIKADQINIEAGTEGDLGTAHRFQGDERDIIIFSPVLSEGISEGSLKWLNRSGNLLNVAITRARVALIIVGDWAFSAGLKQESPYYQLAHYVEELGRVYQRVEDIPLLGGPTVNPIGFILDPHNPEYSRLTLRKFLTSVREYVWWYDPHFSNSILKLFQEIFDDPEVVIKNVRLLTKASKDLDSRFNLLQIQDLKVELAMRGILFEVRVVPGDIKIHDRILFTPGLGINMPPFKSAMGERKHRYVAEYTRTHLTMDDFKQFWEQSIPVEQILSV